MSRRALFEGLVVGEDGNAVETTVVGDAAQYVVWDAGFKFHVDAETIDRQVLRLLGEQLESTRVLSRDGFVARNRVLDLEREHAQVSATPGTIWTRPSGHRSPSEKQV